MMLLHRGSHSGRSKTWSQKYSAAWTFSCSGLLSTGTYPSQLTTQLTVAIVVFSCHMQRRLAR
jgi:hypothetical protein